MQNVSGEGAEAAQSEIAPSISVQGLCLLLYAARKSLPTIHFISRSLLKPRLPFRLQAGRFSSVLVQLREKSVATHYTHM